MSCSKSENNDESQILVINNENTSSSNEETSNTAATSNNNDESGTENSSSSDETTSTEESSSNEQSDPLLNDIYEMKSIFESFDGVITSNDSQFFYVSSNGLPSHNMMVGITNWQQQIPINQNYSDSNSWSIPIKPEISNSPLSSKSNFMTGAMAIAVNGIPIFNPLNNRGEDASEIGELDQWGGHCGKADDYHYHLPPTHLSEIVGKNNPIAYSLDGFPIYGTTTKTLDENLGILNSDGSYHYHTINDYPYFIANMKGKVTVLGSAPNNQIIPQPKTIPIRPSLTPLNGAEITNFSKTSESSYTLTYTLNSEIYSINYSWDNSGHYYFTFTDSEGNSTTETYHN